MVSPSQSEQQEIQRAEREFYRVKGLFEDRAAIVEELDEINDKYSYCPYKQAERESLEVALNRIQQQIAKLYQ